MSKKVSHRKTSLLKAACAVLVFSLFLTGCSEKDKGDDESSAVSVYESAISSDSGNENESESKTESSVTASQAESEGQSEEEEDSSVSALLPESEETESGLTVTESDNSENGQDSEEENTVSEPTQESNGGADSSVAESEPEQQPGYEAESRPEENMEIPYKDTKLYHAFDYVDKYHLYIRTRQHTLSSFGYITHEVEYAFNGVKIYLHQEVNGEHLHYYSDGKQLYGLDFEEQTYTLLAPHSYTADEILYLGDFTHCSSTGKDIFLGTELDYEDYSETDTEWIRYYFHGDGTLAGYERYDTVTNEIIEITSYEVFTSEFPEDAVLYFDIPAGFEKYTDVIDYSDLIGEEW